MDEQVVWSSGSIVRIGSDTPKSEVGDVTISGTTATLGENSKLVYERLFGTGVGTYIKPNKLQLNLNFSTTDTIETRYNELVYVDVNIRYWNGDDPENEPLTTGNWDTFRVYPYLTRETAGYVGTFTLDIQEKYVHTITISFNTSAIGVYTIDINNPVIRYSMNVNEAMQEFSGFGDQIETMDVYNDGIVVYYVGEEMPATLKVRESVVEPDTYIIDISGRYEFPLKINAEDMPFD